MRVIASTNRDLALEIAGRPLPRGSALSARTWCRSACRALRERREDIPDAGATFHGARGRSGAACTPREFGDDALAALQAYDWPGNVRQLRNVVDWLLIMAPGEPGEPIRADMLPAEIGAIAPAVAALGTTAAR